MKLATNRARLTEFINHALPRTCTSSRSVDVFEMSIPEGTLTNCTGTLTVWTVVPVDRTDVLQMAATKPSAASLRRAFENDHCRNLLAIPSVG